MREPQEKLKVSSPIVEEGARRNIFLLLLSISLIVGAIVSLLIIFENYDYRQIFYILYSISAVFLSIAFLWKKEIPRNIGFVTLAIFSLINGINAAQSAFQSDYSYNYVVLNGIMALVSGVFFISQRASWKNFGFLMLSGALITIGLSGLAIYDTTVYNVFLAAFVLFAFPAATFFILRK